MSRQIVPHALKRTIGRRVNSLMKRDSVTQSGLSAILDISEASVSRIRNGIQAPNLENLIAIADAFDTSIDYILGRTQDPVPIAKLTAPDDLKAHIAATLDALLERDNLTAYQLTKKIKATQSALSKIRNGINAPDPNTLIELADHFQVTTDYLLGRASAKT